MFLHRFRTQHWVLLSVIVFAGFLLLLPQGATPSMAAQATATIPPVTPGPNYLPLVYKMPTPTAIPGWHIQYYSNRNLDGSPAATETKTYTFPAEEWGSDGPAVLGGIKDNFSVRFSRPVQFSAGTYAFYLTVDDGGRLYIDGNLVIDRWHGSVRGTATYRHEQVMTAGVHNIVVEYYEATGDARVRLFWLDEQSYPQWRAEYYANPDLSGQPAVVRNEPTIDFRWGTGSPAPGVIPVDHFSARFTRAMYFGAGTRVLFTEADDRVRVWVDRWAPGTELIDGWENRQRWNSANQSMNEAGWYLITIEYAEITGDAVMRYFDLYGASSGSWTAEYFDEYRWQSSHKDDVNVLANRTVDRSENKMYGNEPGIDLNARELPKGVGGTSDNRDHFAVRWIRYFKLDGKYEFTAQWDDGMRIWIDGDLVMDKWKSEGGMVTETFTRTLHDGHHIIKVEYYEGTGSAIARLTWRRI